MTTRRDRRTVLGLVPGAAAVALAPRAARALSVEPAPPAVAAMLAERCEAPSLHVQILDDLLTRLGVDRSDGTAVRRVQAMACPVCGCPLASAGPAGDPKP